MMTTTIRPDALLAVYDRFKHLDAVLEMVQDSDGTEQTDPFHMTARDLWRAIKSSLGHTAGVGDRLDAVVGRGLEGA